MKPINYYIQLSDELSTAIDSLPKKDLVCLALESLHHQYRVQPNALVNPIHLKESVKFCVDYGFLPEGSEWDTVTAMTACNSQGLKAMDSLIKLAHGLLAKATA